MALLQPEQSGGASLQPKTQDKIEALVEFERNGLRRVHHVIAAAAWR
jgi:hypothetical protein